MRQVSTMIADPVRVPTSGISEKKNAIDSEDGGERRTDDRQEDRAQDAVDDAQA